MAIGVRGWIDKAKRDGIAEGIAQVEARRSAEGEARGKAEAEKEITLRLLNQGLGVSDIAAATNLTTDEIEALQQKNNH